jgi:hypothetical protein
MDADMKARIQSAIDNHKAFELDEHSRETYRLACQIINKLEHGKSIDALEKLGKEKLRQIVEWLDEANS